MNGRFRRDELESTQQTVKFFEALLCASTDGIVITDTTQNIIVANEAFCAFLGQRWRDVVETSLLAWLEQLDADAPRRWAELEQRVRLEGSCRDVEFQITRGERVRHLSIDASLLERVADEESGVIISIWRDVTERVRVESQRDATPEVLRESERRFRGVIENTQAGYFYIDRAGRFQQVNSAWLQMHGYASADEVIGQHFAFAQVGVDLEQAQRNVEKLLSGEPIPTGEFTRRCKDGSIGYHTFSASPVVQGGEIVGLEGFLIDITERKLAEGALRESEGRYKRLLGSVTDYIYTVTVEDGRPAETSHGPGCAAVTGYTPEEYEADLHLWYQMICEEDRKAVTEQAGKVLSGEVVPPLEHRIIHKDGSIRWVRNTPVRRYDEKGRLIAYDGLITDISERKRAEEALQESEGQHRSLIEDVLGSTAVGIFILDSDFRVVWVNQALEQYFGLRKEDVIGRGKRKLIQGRIKGIFEDPGRFAKTVLATYDDNTYVEEFECHVLPGDGRKERWLEHRSQPIRSGFYTGGRVELYYNITERVRAESQRDATLEALRQRNRELELLNRASQSFVSILDMDQVLTAVLEEVRHLLDVVACSAWLLDPETGELVCRHVTDPQSELVRGWRLAPGEGIAGWTVRHGDSLIVSDTRVDKRHFKGVDRRIGLEIRSILSVPLRASARGGKQEVVGTIQVVDARAARFDSTDLRLVEALASAASIAIENARLYQDLRASQEYARNIIDSSLDMIVAVDMGRRVVEFNKAAQETFGYRPQEIIGEHISMLYADSQEALAVHNTAVDQEQCVQEILNSRKNGEVFLSLLSASVLRDASGEIVGVMGVSRDISEQKRAEERLKTSLREKEVLLKEIHHRVKNNLQLISSLLDLQTDYVQDPQALAVFMESQSRIKSMALIHERLYQSPDLGQIDFAEYVRDLAAQLFRSYGVTPGAIALTIQSDDVLLNVNTAIPCGLMVNELLSNSLKHAFPPLSSPPIGGGTRGGRACEICIGLHRENERLTLVVGDNGVGFPRDLDFRNTDSLGLQLVTMLTHQLEGTIELDRSDGTTFKISLTI